MQTINNDIQAFYLLKKYSEDIKIGQMENLVPQYLRSGIEVYSHQIYAATIPIWIIVQKNTQQLLFQMHLKIMKKKKVMKKYLKK